MNIKEHGARRIGNIRNMNFAVGEFPNQPAVDGAKKEFSFFCTLTGPAHLIQNPFYFGSRKISINDQAGLLLNFSGFAIGF